VLKLNTNKEIEDFLGINPLQSISIRVTQACNLRCKHCYAAAGVPHKDELSTTEMKKLLDEAKELGALRVFFGGGEPFLRKDILKIYMYASENKYSVYTSTNGCFVTIPDLNKIAKLNMKVFQISIDGVGSTHDYIRGVKGTYAKAIKTLQNAKKILKNTKIAWAFTLSKYNKNEVLKSLDLAVENNADIFALIPLFPAGRMKSTDDVSTSEKNNIFKEVCNYYVSKYIKSSVDTPSLMYLSILSSPGVIPVDFKSIEYGCGFVCTFPNILGIDSNGDVYPCDGLIGDREMFLGNIRDKKLKEIWKSSLMVKLRTINYEDIEGVCQKCAKSDLCMGGCRASSYKLHNNFYKSDYLCQEFYEEGLFPKINLKIKAEKK